jgi:catechol 2,3-dioxygenase-like lactoylglutathione lyase family enzyme
MSVTLDHVGIPAADPEASARFLGEILAEGEATPEGPGGEMVNLSNDPADPTNGQADDPLGGLGRIYFRDANGHLFELFVPNPDSG